MSTGPLHVTFSEPVLTSETWSIKMTSEMHTRVVDLGDGRWRLELRNPTDALSVWFRDFRPLTRFAAEGKHYMSLQWLDTWDIEVRCVGDVDAQAPP